MNGLKQIAYFGLSTLLLKGLGFALLPISTRLLSQAQFGELNFLVSISAIMSLLLCLGLPELLFKQQMKNAVYKQALFRDAIILCSVLSALFVVIMVLFTSSFSVLLPISINKLDLQLLAVNLAFSAVLTIVFCFLRYYEMAKQFCFLAILQGVGQTLLTIILLYLGYGVTGVMVSGAVSSFIVLMISLCVIGRTITISFNYVPWNISYKNSLFLLSIIASSLFVYANNGAENWFIAASVGKEKLAQYYVAMQFAVMTSFTFEPIRMWWFSRRFNELTSCRTRYVSLCELSLEIAIALCAVMLIVAPHLFILVLPQGYLLNSWLLPSLIFIVVLRHHSDLLNIGCYIHFNALFVTIINAVSAACVLIALGILVPKWGVLGAVVSLVFAQTLKTVLFVVVSQKLENLAFSIQRLVPSWLCFISVFALSVSEIIHYVIWQIAALVCLIGVLFNKYQNRIMAILNQYVTRKAHG
ncbi:oligosaccharide flippase family protein [Pseudoalteromonas sp. SR45-6]|uniref:lipopolysaccharide biosynthesis protein n=1 Tax=Pseudoalteromonas sp. SR45-6 TaxID=2760927 RepID=UPI0016035E82|nr:oligosaccharide flippase family protein [Pseudoalteromonas sp. SR45-6]MBB1341351.1 oligosaccharide flippase family protein [Pseudoalteromonas sp. SR45-6]